MRTHSMPYLSNVWCMILIYNQYAETVCKINRASLCMACTCTDCGLCKVSVDMLACLPLVKATSFQSITPDILQMLISTEQAASDPKQCAAVCYTVTSKTSQELAFSQSFVDACWLITCTATVHYYKLHSYTKMQLILTTCLARADDLLS